MAFLLKLVDSEDTIDFLSTTFRLEDKGFDQGKPMQKIVMGGNYSYGGGQSLVSIDYDNRSIEITFNVKGATREDLLAAINRIDDVLYRCHFSKLNRTYEHTELQYQWEGASNINYFDIIAGELTWPDDIMSVEQVHQKEEGKYVLYGFKLTLTAAPFIDSLSPVSNTYTDLTLYNPAYPSGESGGIGLYNRNDGSGYFNNVWINGSDVPGDYPADLKLEIAGSVTGIKRVYVGIGPRGTDNYAYHSEAEVQSISYPGEDPLLISVSESTCSGGKYVPVVIGGGDLNAVIPLIYHESFASSDPYAPGAYRFFYMFDKTTTTTARFRLRFQTLTSGGDVLAVGEWVEVFENYLGIIDLGTFIFPQNLVGPGQSSLSSAVAVLDGYFETTGTYRLDALYAIPVEYGMRVYEVHPSKMASGYTTEKFIDDGRNGVTYSVSVSANKPIRNIIPYMPSLKLEPGRDVCVTCFYETWDDTYGWYGDAMTGGWLKMSIQPKYKSAVT